MTRKLLTLCTTLLLLGSMALTAEGGRRGNSSPRLWVRSLSGATNQITVGRTAPGAGSVEEAIPLSSSEWAEVVRNPGQEELRLGSGRDLLVVNATSGFDITAVEISPRSLRPAAARSTETEGVLRANQQASLPVASKRGPLPVAFVLAARHSSVELQLRSAGKLVGFVNVASEQPASVQLDLRSLIDRRLAAQSLQVDLRVMRGEVSGMSSRGMPFRASATPKSFGGYATFNHTANWQQTSDLYYYITSAPISTCGELQTYRNGSWLYSSGWACTDGSGSVTKGPWSWSSTPSDQTDDPVYIRWPDGSSTPSLTHYWDKTCPQITRTSSGGSPPGTYYGTASDTQWGACFSASWPSYLYSFFVDQSSHLYWDPSTGTYSSSSPVVVYGSLSGMPSCGVGWSTSFPSPSAHTTGDDYLWETCVVEVESNEGCAVCTNLLFTH